MGYTPSNTWASISDPDIARLWLLGNPARVLLHDGKPEASSPQLGEGERERESPLYHGNTSRAAGTHLNLLSSVNSSCNKAS